MSVLRGAWAPAAVTGLGVAHLGDGVLVGAVLVVVLVGLLLVGRAAALRTRAPHGRHRAQS